MKRCDGVQLRARAIELRKQNRTIPEIHKKLGIAKSTLSIWLRAYPITTNRCKTVPDLKILEVYDKTQSLRATADALSCSTKKVRYHLSAAGYTSRSVKAHLCRRCGESRPKYFYAHQKSLCRACRNKDHARRIRGYKRQEVDAKGGACSRCGYAKSLAALHFHHSDPSSKDPFFLRMRNWSAAARATELAKCVLLCANCHAEEHERWLNEKRSDR